MKIFLIRRRSNGALIALKDLHEILEKVPGWGMVGEFDLAEVELSEDSFHSLDENGVVATMREDHEEEDEVKGWY